MATVCNFCVIVLLSCICSSATKSAFSTKVNLTKLLRPLGSNHTSFSNDEKGRFAINYRDLPGFIQTSRALEPHSFDPLDVLEYYRKETKISEDKNEFVRILDALSSYQVNNDNKFSNHNLTTCINDTTRLIAGFLTGESWAIPFFDATGKPGPSLTLGRLNFVGNYDQCRRSASALSNISLDEEGHTHEFHGGYFQLALRSPTIPTLIQIGACLPDTCSEKEIESMVREMIQAANSSLSLAFVHNLTNATEITPATVLAIFISCFTALMMVLGTMFDCVFFQFPLWYDKSQCNKDCDPQDQSTCDEERPILNKREENVGCFRDVHKRDHPQSTTTKILMAFSVYSNVKKIVNTHQTPDSIQSIHGIRFFSITWVMLAHTYAFGNEYAVNPASGYWKFLNRWTFDVVANSFTCVDTFFTISGLLTSYVAIGTILKKGFKFNWPAFYFHRFWRLTPPYMFVLIIYLGFQQYFIQGPLRNYEQPIDKEACEKHWWTNLLYINNLIYTAQGEICLGHSWYLSNDMQFFILSPLLMIPFYFHRFFGLCMCAVFILVSWIITGVLSTVDEWPPTGPNLKLNIRGLQSDDWLNHYYAKPWCRIGPYIIGILAGYVLKMYKERRFCMKWWIVALCWMTAGGSALAVVYGLRGDINGNDPSSIGASALYNSVARTVWGACVSWVIVACTVGYGGPVLALLSWPPFVLLGRLSYMVYLVHVPVLFIFYQNSDHLFYVNDTTMVVYFLGIVVASHLVAFVFMLGLESPVIGIGKIILKR